MAKKKKNDIQPLGLKEGIPILIDKDGEIICLPISKEEPKIGVVRKRGRGMSWTLHRMVDLAYWKGKRKIAILNDDKEDCDFWKLPLKKR